MYYANYYKSLLKNVIKESIQAPKAKTNDSNFLDLGIFNPSIGTSNLGDLIIQEAVYRELRSVYVNDLLTNFPSQLHTDFNAKLLMREKDYLFVAGTNLLSSNMDRRFQWKLDPGHKRFLANKVILFGVGWWQYQKEPNKYTKELYKRIFNSDYLHSVRDSFTLEMLKQIGIDNVINTTCPTLWNLSDNLCLQVPCSKVENVVTTLTFYKSDPELDRRMLEILIGNYKKVYLWVQGLADITYLHQILKNTERIKLVPPTIEAFDKVLDDPSVEYVGTRLHAGVRALQRKVRTLIIAVDNRALEIAKDTNLNVIPRENVDKILDFIDMPYKTEIKLPLDNISKWRKQLPQVRK